LEDILKFKPKKNKRTIVHFKNTTMKVLNLYSCLGGNRKLWKDCEVTAVELDPELAKMYKHLYPGDKVIVQDAHDFLINNFKDFDFIWSSPPCPSHSRARFWKHSKDNPIYPDLKLYEQIILLNTHFNGKFVIENVKPYYKTLIHPSQEIDRHFYWSNFVITKPSKTRNVNVCQGKDEIKRLELFHDVSIKDYKGNQRKDKILRNMVDYKVGNHIFNLAKGIHESNNTKQTKLF